MTAERVELKEEGMRVLSIAFVIGAIALIGNFTTVETASAARGCPAGQVMSNGGGGCITNKRKSCWQAAGLPRSATPLPNHPNWGRFTACMG
jgi:hypothetical protein